MEKQELQTILEKHKLWLMKVEGGERANLYKADLTGINLSGDGLSWINLSWGNLSYANLRGVNLANACLTNANLFAADLCGAILSRAELQKANLINALLRGAALDDADLLDAELCNADLRRANLSGANLDGANLRNAIWNSGTIGIHQAPEGELIGWHKYMNHIIKVLIPAETPRSCGTTRRFRAAQAVILEIDNGATYHIQIEHTDGTSTEYKVGQTIIANSWDTNRWHERSGILFFLTREEAEAWIGISEKVQS